MALVRSLDKKDPGRTHIHDEVECEYFIFLKEGKSFLQLDTYGSQNRKIKGKTSQTIQFDETSAKALVEILRSEFSI